MDQAEFGFLFRQSDGTISAPLWRRWTLVLTGLCLGLALIWRLISPWTQRNLATQSLFDVRAFVAFVYLLVFAVGLLLAQVSQYNLSAKRFRAKNHAPGWAAVWPLAAFVAGAAFWAQPNFFGLLPEFVPWLFLLVAFAAFLAQFFELGFRPD
jgi:uncharacterized membrane protein YhaH (DUF805 family)